MKDSLNIAIAGATGYVGLELIKILINHPKVKIKYLCAKSSVGKKIGKFDKKLSGKKLPTISNISNVQWNKLDVLFTALPNGEAQSLAKKIKGKTKLIDLSADFRLNKTTEYKKWYGLKHKSSKLIKNSIYALSEFTKKSIKDFKIISCPGCYPTSIQLPLIPLLEKKIINPNNIIVDSKSGLSGAGKNIHKKFNFRNINNSVSAYGVGWHRHMAEIDQELSKYAKKKINIVFTPHLIPMFRGILSTIYLDVNSNINAKKVYNFLRRYHKKNTFVKFAKFNKPISTNDVINTNFCKLSVCKNRSKNKIIIISVIDNLVKGASGQAVQNMNLLYNYNESLGLI